MAFKFVILSALLAVASAGYIAQVPTHYAAGGPAMLTKVVNPSVDAVASTHQNVVRSFGGTISQHSKSVQTPYSSVHKEDTRINNNVYTPTVTKTVTYAAPEASAVYTSHAAPVVTKTVYSAPQIHEEQQNHVYASPTAPTAAIYTHAVPTHNVYTHSAPSSDVYSHAGPSASVYSHNSNVYSTAPAPTAAVYTHSTPTTTVYQHEVPSTSTTTYSHGPAAAVYHQEVPSTATTTYSHSSPATVHHQEVPSTATTITAYHQAPTATVYQHEVPSTATTTYNHGPSATTYSHNGNGVSAYGTSQTVRYSPAEMVSHMSFDGFGTHWGY